MEKSNRAKEDANPNRPSQNNEGKEIPNKTNTDVASALENPSMTDKDSLIDRAKRKTDELEKNPQASEDSTASKFFVDLKKSASLNDKIEITQKDSQTASMDSSTIKSPTDGTATSRKWSRFKEQKKTVGLIRMSFEKKVGDVERKLEDRVEKIWEENLGKHSWLMPIDTWIADRRKSNTSTNQISEQERKIRRKSIEIETQTDRFNEDFIKTDKSDDCECKKTEKDEDLKQELREVERKQREMERELREMEEDLREMDERLGEEDGKSDAEKSETKRATESALEIQKDSRERSALSTNENIELNEEERLEVQAIPRDTGQRSVEMEKNEEEEKNEVSRDIRQKERVASSNETPKFDFRFTPASRETDEPSIESKVEYSGNSRGSPKSDRSHFDLPAGLISRLRKLEHFRTRSADDVRYVEPIDNEGILEMKDVKHQDLFDKLKDNVKEKMEDIHRYFQRTNRLADVNRRLKSQIWSSVVTIVLVEAKNLLPMDIDGLSDPYVKFRLGTEKYKSKVVNKTLNPVWLEQFDLHLYEDPYLGQELEVTVWDRDRSHQDDLMGRTVIDLATLERETTHRLWKELEDGSGSIFLLLTISGTTASETISDLAAHEETPYERVRLMQRYSIMNTLQRPRDVGHLIVKVYRAQGLAAADLGGKSDPFCVLELVNARLQTQTEYKTLAPNWQKIFTFNVKDINSVLEVTVYDEDRDHKVEFLGRVAIPLLRIRNGEKRWYALKDKKMRGRAKGNSPQILLEMTVIWNVIRACIRTLNPKEKKYMEPEIKFKRQVFLRNVLRLKAIIVIFIDMGKYVQSCWEWESKPRSVVALVLFILGCYYFEPYMIPTIAVLILLKYYLSKKKHENASGNFDTLLPHARGIRSALIEIPFCSFLSLRRCMHRISFATGQLSGERSGFNQWISEQVAVVTGVPLSQQTSHFHDANEIGSDDCPPTPGDDDDDEDDKDKEEKKSLKERLQAIQEVTQTVQNSIGYIASLCERVKNLFNFTVPYLSYLAMLLAILGMCVLYFIPVRYLILVWGVNKFSRKIFRPHSVPNNELLDLVSRVPDDEELLNYRELKPLPTADCEKGTASGSAGNTARREQRKRHKVA